jgi:hypothetical protein
MRDHAFTEGRWRATPVWYCVSFGRNLNVAEHLMKLGASPQYSLYAAAYNRDTDAIRLLVRYGADIEEPSGPGETPFLGAIGWSHFEAAAAMCTSLSSDYPDFVPIQEPVRSRRQPDPTLATRRERSRLRAPRPRRRGACSPKILRVVRMVQASDPPCWRVRNHAVTQQIPGQESIRL